MNWRKAAKLIFSGNEEPATLLFSNLVTLIAIAMSQSTTMLTFERARQPRFRRGVAKASENSTGASGEKSGKLLTIRWVRRGRGGGGGGCSGWRR